MNTRNVDISLDEKDFDSLVNGKAITKTAGITDVNIVLKDIGFYTMNRKILNARKNLSANKSNLCDKEHKLLQGLNINDQILKRLQCITNEDLVDH